MGKKYLLECATDSVESALAAARGGADRLELCSNLIIGGTTPTMALFDEVRSHSDIPLFILIRPRFGDFLYSDYEANVICREIEMFQKAGAQGVVIGSLNRDGSLNEEHMKRFIEKAKDMSITLHRAFDMCRDLDEALDDAKKLGIVSILTSGGCATALEGLDTLNRLKQNSGNIGIMAGAGITQDTLRYIKDHSCLTSFHMSGKKVIKSQMEYRNPKVSMGLPSLSEYEIWQTDEETIRQAKLVLK